MRNIIIAACAALLLVGCQTIDTIDAYIKKNLPIACQGVDLAHQGFLIAHAARPFNDTILASEATSYANARTLCDNPSTVNSVALVTTIFQTVIQINGYIRSAERAGVQ